MAKHVYLIVAFDSLDHAEDVYKKIEQAEKEKLVEIDDAVVVTKDEHGKLRHKDIGRHAASTGAKWGGALGLLIGIGLGGPIGGAVVGAAGGAVAGALGDAYSKLLDAGFSKDQIEMVGEHLQYSSSALLIKFVGGDVRFIRNAAKQSAGELLEFEVIDQQGEDVEASFSKGTERDR